MFSFFKKNNNNEDNIINIIVKNTIDNSEQLEKFYENYENDKNYICEYNTKKYNYKNINNYEYNNYKNFINKYINYN
jgi:hypothetical protein